MLEFPEAFWDADMDYFGAALPGGTDGRGRCFMFWNLQRFTGAPVLVALVAGAAAGEAEAASDAEMGAAAVQVLRRVYGADVVPEPRCVLATRWASEEYTRGAQVLGLPAVPCDACRGHRGVRCWTAWNRHVSRFVRRLWGILTVFVALCISSVCGLLFESAHRHPGCTRPEI